MIQRLSILIFFLVAVLQIQAQITGQPVHDFEGGYVCYDSAGIKKILRVVSLHEVSNPDVIYSVYYDAVGNRIIPDSQYISLGLCQIESKDSLLINLYGDSLYLTPPVQYQVDFEQGCFLIDSIPTIALLEIVYASGTPVMQSYLTENSELLFSNYPPADCSPEDDCDENIVMDTDTYFCDSLDNYYRQILKYCDGELDEYWYFNIVTKEEVRNVSSDCSYSTTITRDTISCSYSTKVIHPEVGNMTAKFSVSDNSLYVVAEARCIVSDCNNNVVSDEILVDSLTANFCYQNINPDQFLDSLGYIQTIRLYSSISGIASDINVSPGTSFLSGCAGTVAATDLVFIPSNFQGYENALLTVVENAVCALNADAEISVPVSNNGKVSICFTCKNNPATDWIGININDRFFDFSPDGISISSRDFSIGLYESTRFNCFYPSDCGNIDAQYSTSHPFSSSNFDTLIFQSSKPVAYRLGVNSIDCNIFEICVENTCPGISTQCWPNFNCSDSPCVRWDGIGPEPFPFTGCDCIETEISICCGPDCNLQSWTRNDFPICILDSLNIDNDSLTTQFKGYEIVLFNQATFETIQYFEPVVPPGLDTMSNYIQVECCN